jgi:CheY-like chemotaxis protein
MATILVVDDEPALLDLLVDILDGEGHEMLAALTASWRLGC